MQAQARAVEREAGLKDQLSSFKEEATKQITELTAQLKQKVQIRETRMDGAICDPVVTMATTYIAVCSSQVQR